MIVASSDMNHYESDAITRVKDRIAIEPILCLDARAVYDAVTQQHISMCGFGPAVAMLTATKKLAQLQPNWSNTQPQAMSAATAIWS